MTSQIHDMEFLKKSQILFQEQFAAPHCVILYYSISPLQQENKKDEADAQSKLTSLASAPLLCQAFFVDKRNSDAVSVTRVHEVVNEIKNIPCIQ